MQLINALKEAGEDHEFYPTTKEIIDAMLADVARRAEERGGKYNYQRIESVLDVGAGNGKVLEAFRHDDFNITHRYAIEKSPILCQQLPDDVMIVGTDFEQQSLISKPVDVVFSNPPYSVFEPWAVKVIREASARYVYLVIPQRWQESIEIREALKFRDVEAVIVGDFDFENSEDRRARAKVHLIRIEPQGKKEDDAFERFFNEAFGGIRTASKAETVTEAKTKERFAQLVVGANYPETMVALYNEEMVRIQQNYAAVATLDPAIMSELDISISTILGALKARLDGLRNLYWKELFSRLSTITERITSKRRNKLLEALNRHVHVDFTVNNIHVIVLWVIKNANQNLDDQLIEVFEDMVDKANIRNYKSNQRVFEFDRWRYQHGGGKSEVAEIALDYRIVLQHMGGISTSSYSWEKGLRERAADFLRDLMTVARNLGFQCNNSESRLLNGRSEWVAGRVEDFDAIHGEKRVQLFDVKAFKNGNLHIRLNQKFALALNVEYGRLKGWLKSGAQAADELNDPEAASVFATHFALPMSNVLQLAA